MSDSLTQQTCFVPVLWRAVVAAGREVLWHLTKGGLVDSFDDVRQAKWTTTLVMLCAERSGEGRRKRKAP
jgi:hypothetical protein